MLVGQIGDVGYQVGLVYTVRNLGYHNLIVCVAALNLGLGTHHDTTATSLVSILNTLQAIDVSTCWEVRSWNVLHQALGINLRIVDISTATIDYLAQVVGRHIGSHTYGNTVTTVNQQVGHLGWHNGWLLERVVEVGGHIYGFLIQVVHNVLTHL